MVMRDIYFRTPFATSGDKTPIPNLTDPAGAVSMMQGYGPDYQRDLETDPLAKSVERAGQNWLFNQLSSVIGRWQAETIPEWVTPADNGGVALAYGIGTQVRYRPTDSDPFLSYVSTADANVTVPGAVGATWVQTSLGVTAPQFNESKAAASTEFVKKSGLSHSATFGFTASATLSAAHAGAFIYTFGAGGFPLTLPVANTMPLGSTITYSNQGGVSSLPVTILTQGGNTLQLNGGLVSSCMVTAGASLTFVAISATGWMAVGTGALSKSADFASLLSAAGYMKLPGDFTMQWQNVTVPVAAVGSVSTASFSFPIAFKTLAFGCTPSALGPTLADANAFVCARPTSINGGIVQSNYTGSALTVFIVSIGN